MQITDLRYLRIIVRCFNELYKQDTMKTLKTLMLLLVAFVMSCETNTFEMEPSGTVVYDHILGVNPEAAQDSTPELTYYDLNTGDICMLNMSRRRIDMILNEQECLASIEYGEDGLVKNIFLDSLTVCFSNYNGTTVDMVMVRGDESCIFTECEIGTDTEELRSAAMQRGGSFQTRGAMDAVLAIDQYLKDHQQDINKVFESADHLMDLIGDKLTGNILNKLKIGERIDRYSDDLLGKALEVSILPDEIKNHLEDILTAKDAYNLAGELSIGDGRYKDVKKLRKFKRFNIFYDFLKLAMTNYTEWSEGWEDIWYRFFMWRESVHKENEALANGALNSGYGDLKATLSWNFKADIDLHAIEPTGYHIYFGDKVSTYTGGFLDVDNIQGGPGSVENIYWSEPVDGEYTIYINYFGSSYGYPSGNCKVALFYKGQSIGVYNVSMSYGMGEQHIRTFTISSGLLGAPAIRTKFVVEHVDVEK